MFKVEVDHSFIMINKGVKLTPKELVTNWMDTTNRNNKIELVAGRWRRCRFYAA